MADEHTIVAELKRSEIRYAIFRCRSGNPEEHHLDIYNYYGEKLKPHGLDFTTFTTLWDVDVNDPTIIVSGIGLTPLKEKIDSSLFNEDGSLKDE